MMQLEPKKFYAIGKFTFFAVALCSLISLIDKFGTMTGTQIVSQIAYIIFYSAIIGSFTYLQNQLGKPVASEKEMEAMLNKFDKEEIKCQDLQKKKQ